MCSEDEANAVVRSCVKAFDAGELYRLAALLADDAQVQGVAPA